MDTVLLLYKCVANLYYIILYFLLSALYMPNRFKLRLFLPTLLRTLRLRVCTLFDNCSKRTEIEPVRCALYFVVPFSYFALVPLLPPFTPCEGYVRGRSLYIDVRCTVHTVYAVDALCVILKSVFIISSWGKLRFNKAMEWRSGSVYELTRPTQLGPV